MKELSDLVRAWRSLPPATPVVLATVVATSGSTYRRAGARMLITQEGWVAGSVSGGCLEGDLLRSAWERTADGPAVVTYDASSDADIVWGFGLGCNGVVQVLLQRLPEDGGVLAALEACIENRMSVVLKTSLLDGVSTVHEDAVEEEGFLIERIAPPRSLFVFGAGHDAVPLVAIAKGLGWHVTVVDHRPVYARAERFPDADRVAWLPPEHLDELPIDTSSAVVLMTHNYLQDAALLERLIGSPAPYIGMLGPRRRTDRILNELPERPTEAELDKLHAPIGLDLGAEEPAEIALCIVAEIQAFFNGRAARPLRGHDGPLHVQKTVDGSYGVLVPVQCGLAG